MKVYIIETYEPYGDGTHYAAASLSKDRAEREADELRATGNYESVSVTEEDLLE